MTSDKPKSHGKKGMSGKPLLSPEAVEETFRGFVTSTPIWFDTSSGVLSVNTQARRLGIFVYLVGQISNKRSIESLLLSLPAEDLAAVKSNLGNSKFKSGHLTARPSSVNHYLQAVIDLGLVVRQGAVLRLTSRGQFLLTAVSANAHAPYPLARSTKIFFLFTILQNDYFGIAAIVRSLIKGATQLAAIQRDHQAQLLHLLSDVTERSENARLSRLLQDRSLSIRNWTKPESYSEHLVSAKLNWLADLGVLDMGHSLKSKIVINSEHEAWMKALAEPAVPTDTHLLTLILKYSFATLTNQPDMNSDVCNALDAAFERLAGDVALQKIRCNDFLLFLLCSYSNLLAQLVAKRTPVFPRPIIECTRNTYKAHFASRSTQSFIVVTP